VLELSAPKQRVFLANEAPLKTAKNHLYLMHPKRLLPLLSLLACMSPSSPASPITVEVDASKVRAISTDLVGIFFEDISHSADGGLYAELVQNRSFAYSALSRPEWNQLTSWELTPRGGRGSLSLSDATPLHPNNPTFAVMEVHDAGGVALANSGYGGISVTAGESYLFSCYARRLYTGGRWDGVKSTAPLPVFVRLESKEGKVLAEAQITVAQSEWVQYAAKLNPTATVSDAKLVLLCVDRGGLGLDEISLFPSRTFKDRPNGLRADLAQVIADLKPRFMRFPGGCLVHGNSVSNFYRWKDTIGPVEHRRQQPNIWGYHQSVGLGYFEYFQFCKDIGAMPIPIIPAAVSCQNSGHSGGGGQQCVAMEDMPAFIQDVMDLIEWANGPADSTWGSKRAAAGHPEPFGLRHLGIGNEDHITPGFEERFQMIHDAVKVRHPEITLIGTSGPFAAGDDFERGWQLARKLHVDMVDEHYYQPPQWFWDNLSRYDSYPRTGPKVYVGEYAAHDDRRRSTWRAALAEAAHLTAMERNGDIVRLASYAPLLAKRGNTNWSPNLIHFSNTAVFPTLSYEVQKLFRTNSGDRAFDTRLLPPFADPRPEHLAFSAVSDPATGEMILKLVNGAPYSRTVRIRLTGLARTPNGAVRTITAVPDQNMVNEDGAPSVSRTETNAMRISGEFDCELPANSISMLRIPIGDWNQQAP
jgi:alpha-L-arabinofuranosidase